MITFLNLSKDDPYVLLKQKYEEAISLNQKNIEAMSISSFNTDLNMVDSRYVNLKIIDNNRFIFFTDYRSPKANAFESFNQVSALLFWPSINSQIRIKAKIEKTTVEFNKAYFKKRSINKNALSISSNQSKEISDYDDVVKNYWLVRESHDLGECPSYWGGYSLIPFQIEFWEGNKDRLNKRNLYSKKGNSWHHSILEP